MWRKIETFVRERMAEQAKVTADTTVATERGVDLRFAEVQHRSRRSCESTPAAFCLETPAQFLVRKALRVEVFRLTGRISTN